MSQAKYFTLIQIHQEMITDESPVVAETLEQVDPSDYLPPLPTIDDLSLLDGLDDLDFDFGLEGLGDSES